MALSDSASFIFRPMDTSLHQTERKRKLRVCQHQAYSTNKQMSEFGFEHLAYKLKRMKGPTR